MLVHLGWIEKDHLVLSLLAIHENLTGEIGLDMKWDLIGLPENDPDIL